VDSLSSESAEWDHMSRFGGVVLLGCIMHCFVYARCLASSIDPSVSQYMLDVYTVIQAMLSIRAMLLRPCPKNAVAE
jgi:hypothetical protein